MPVISATALTLLSGVLSYVASYLKSDKAPASTNACIGIVATLVSAIIVAWMTGFTGDLTQNLLLIVTCFALFLHQLVTLMQQVQQAPSPLERATAAPAPIPQVAPVVIPQSVTPDLAPLSSALIHITANAVHIPTSLPAPSPATGLLVQPEKANEKTEKMSVVKPATTPLAKE